VTIVNPVPRPLSARLAVFAPTLLARLLGLTLAMLLPLAAICSPVLALSARDLPATTPSEHVIDQADVLSRASRAELERRLERLGEQRVDARLVTVTRLDYGLSLDELGGQLLERWQDESEADGKSPLPLLLLLIDSQTKTTAVVASTMLEGQLPDALLRSTAQATMAQPLRLGERYRQATLDAINRLEPVLQGEEDPGPPPEQEEAAVVSNIPSREETRNGNGFTWVVVLLVVGSVVPMLTWWVFSR
jgi:uncharacterized protein